MDYFVSLLVQYFIAVFYKTLVISTLIFLLKNNKVVVVKNTVKKVKFLLIRCLSKRIDFSSEMTMLSKRTDFLSEMKICLLLSSLSSLYFIRLMTTYT